MDSNVDQTGIEDVRGVSQNGTLRLPVVDRADAEKTVRLASATISSARHEPREFTWPDSHHPAPPAVFDGSTGSGSSPDFSIRSHASNTTRRVRYSP